MQKILGSVCLGSHQVYTNEEMLGKVCSGTLPCL